VDAVIGENAGRIWRFLEERGEAQSVGAISKGLGMKDGDVRLALGWLAREGKLDRKSVV